MRNCGIGYLSRRDTSSNRLLACSISDKSLGLPPKPVTFPLLLEIICGMVNASGYNGLPSYVTMLTPLTSCPTCKSHMIHPQVVTCRNVSCKGVWSDYEKRPLNTHCIGKIILQKTFFLAVDENSSSRMTNRLRLACCTTGKHNEGWVIERQRLKDELWVVLRAQLDRR